MIDIFKFWLLLNAFQYMYMQNCDSILELYQRPPISMLRLTVSFLENVPQIRQLATHFSPRRPGFNPTASHVICVVHTQALQQVYSSGILVCTLPVLAFYQTVTIISYQELVKYAQSRPQYQETQSHSNAATTRK
jgi:hypothetical protein